MTPYVLISFGCLVLALVSFGEGFRRGQRKAEAASSGALNRIRLDNFAAGRDEGYRAGFKSGEDHGFGSARTVALDTLEASFPTSLGGRTIVRALGGTPGPLPRKKAEPAPVDVPDAGEGPETL